MTTRIAILGDFNPGYSTHHALNNSVRQIVRKFSEDLQFDWISTDTFNAETAFDGLYSGLWIAPGSPYKDMQNVLKAITYARLNSVPTFGNCGGFQHIMIEFARNVCGIVHADHEETNAGASDLLISKLSCSLVEQEEELTIVKRDSILYKVIQRDTLSGRYFCNYGLNGKYREALQAGGLLFTALSNDGQVRAFEIERHPFFVGTLFQPALTSTFAEPNPLIIEFVRQSLNFST